MLMRLFAICVALLAGAHAQSGATRCHTPDNSNLDLCGSSYCLPEESHCEQGSSCGCTYSQKGEPELMCVDDTTDNFANIVGESQASTINNDQHGQVPVPCGYLFTRFQNDISGQDSATCDVRLYVHNKRVGGNMYVAGFELHAISNGLRNDKHWVYKASGWTEGDQYCFNYTVSNRGGEPGSYYANVNRRWAKVNGAPTLYYVDQLTNRLLFQSQACGVQLAFRPVNEALGADEQVWLPGLVVKMDLLYNVNYLSTDVVALPEGHGISSGRDVASALTYLAFTANGNLPDGAQYHYIDFAEYSDQCLAARTSLEACSSQASADTATQSCGFILQNPDFVSCASDQDTPNGVNRILTLYNTCVDAFCSSSPVDRCNELNSMLNDLDDACFSTLENVDRSTGVQCSAPQ